MPTRALLLLLWICATCLLGCGGRRDDAIALTTWSLAVNGAPTGTTVRLPAHLDEHLPDGPAEYTLQTNVVVPPEWRGRALTFAVPHLQARTSLRVNGHQAVMLDPILGEVYRGSGHPRWRVPPELSHNEEIALEIAVEHRWTQSGWFDSIPRLCATEQGDRVYLAVRSINKVSAIFALAMALFVFFAYAIIFLLDRRRTAHGWFTLEAFAACSYPAFELGLLQPFAGDHDGVVTLVMIALATTASLHFTCTQFKLGRPHIACDLGFLVCVVAGLIWHGPFELTLRAGRVIGAVVALHVAYQLALLVYVYRRQGRPLTALLLFLSWGALALTSSVDVAAWLGLGELLGGVRGACVGITIIALAQSAELSIEHISSLRRADELNAELATRIELLQSKNRDIEILNEELKFQVQSRSEQLASALAKVGKPQGRTRALEPGEIIEARYRVVRPVGEGAMGAVYEVERIRDKRRLALKVLTDVSGGLNVARFAREAQIVSQIEHPNVISIEDVDVSSAGFFYMVMEFVPGLSLRQQQHRYTDPDWVVPVLRQIAEGLAAVHARGIVHRDLKPGNVLVTTGERDKLPHVKIADFGISSLESGTDGEPPTANETPASRGAHLGAERGRPEAAPQSLREGLPQSLREGLPQSLREGPPQSLREGLPQSLREGPPQSLREGPPQSLRGGALSSSDGAQSPPKSLRDILPPLPPQSSRSMADRLMERLHDSWDTGPVSARGGPGSSRSGPISSRGGQRSLGPVRNSLTDPLTQTGALMGTPIYMAPELASGVKFAKPSADVFSLGVIGYEMLTGKAPFSEPPALVRLAGRTSLPPEPLTQACPKVDPTVAAIIERCLATNPADRPTAREVAEVLSAAMKLCA